MTPEDPSRYDSSRSRERLGHTVISDFRRGDLKRSIRRDLNELYRFYLDDRERDRLASMGRLHRWFHVTWWLLKRLILRLPPARRFLLLVCLFLLFYGNFSISTHNLEFNFHMSIVSFVLLLVILMLELKDKLLARDELEVGRAVQLALMPTRNPELEGWDIWLFTRPANDVGGDLVDYLEDHHGNLGLVLGDVSGKGLGAALLMAKLQSTMRALAPDCATLSDLGEKTNIIFCRDGIPGRFATMVYMQIEPGSGTVRLLNAGHPPPILLQGKKRESPPSVALPVGIFPDAVYKEQRIAIEPGGMLIAYSDGLTEARNAKMEFYGDDLFEKLLPRLNGLSPVEAGTMILAEVDRFVGDERPFDDLSLILIRRTA